MQTQGCGSSGCRRISCRFASTKRRFRGRAQRCVGGKATSSDCPTLRRSAHSFRGRRSGMVAVAPSGRSIGESGRRRQGVARRHSSRENPRVIDERTSVCVLQSESGWRAKQPARQSVCRSVKASCFGGNEHMSYQTAPARFLLWLAGGGVLVLSI